MPIHFNTKRLVDFSQGTKYEKFMRFLRGIRLPIIILFCWELTGFLQMVPETLLPRPSTVFQKFIELSVRGELLHHFLVSLRRSLSGFFVGGFLALVAGVFVGFFSKVEQSIDPTVQMFRTIPTLAVLPLFILWFGFGEFSKTLLIAKASFFPIYVNTFLGIRGVDSKLLDVAKVLEFSKWKQITKLIIPSAMPNILLGIRLSLGASWVALVGAELMGSSEGIGYMIVDARTFSQTSVIFVGIIIFALFGKLTDSLIRYFEKRLLKWRENFKG
ncbi:ABC transporter permease [Metabacillus sediminilitoris]